MLNAERNLDPQSEKPVFFGEFEWNRFILNFFIIYIFVLYYSIGFMTMHKLNIFNWVHANVPTSPHEKRTHCYSQIEKEQNNNTNDYCKRNKIKQTTKAIHTLKMGNGVSDRIENK